MNSDCFLHLSHFTATSSIGRGLNQTLDALSQRRAGLTPCAFDTVDLAIFIGEVGVDAVQLLAHLADFDAVTINFLAGIERNRTDQSRRLAISHNGTIMFYEDRLCQNP